jgi:hypothetical protein
MSLKKSLRLIVTMCPSGGSLTLSFMGRPRKYSLMPSREANGNMEPQPFFRAILPSLFHPR